jgi:hypothetical protein
MFGKSVAGGEIEQVWTINGIFEKTSYYEILSYYGFQLSFKLFSGRLEVITVYSQ